MIYLFCGDDSKKKNSAYGEFINSISKNAEVFSVSRNNFDKIQIESLYKFIFKKIHYYFSKYFRLRRAKEFYFR